MDWTFAGSLSWLLTAHAQDETPLVSRKSIQVWLLPVLRLLAPSAEVMPHSLTNTARPLDIAEVMLDL